MDRREPLDGGRHLDLGPVMGIAQDAPVGAGGKREQRMFHAGHVVLGNRIEDIAEKEISLPVTIGQ